MRIRIISVVLVMAAGLFLFSACSNDRAGSSETSDTSGAVDSAVPDETDEPVIPTPLYTEVEVGAENTLTNAGTTITLNVSDNCLLITNAATTVSGINMLTENSVYALPKSYQTEFGAEELHDLNWTFTSAAKFENKEVNGVLTSGLVYKFEDTEQNVKLRVSCVVRNDLSGPFEFCTELENCGGSDFRVAPFAFATFSVPVPDPETTSVFRVKCEGWLAEGFRFNSDNDTVHSGTGITSTRFSEFPTNNMVSSHATTVQNQGHLLAQYLDRDGRNGLFYALEWTCGNVIVTDNKDGTAAIELNMDARAKNSRFFSTEIPSGDTFLFPSVYLMPYDGSVDDGSNVFKDWFFACKAPSALRDNPAEPLTQIDAQMTPTDAAAVNLDSIKYEYGWWSDVNFHQSDARPWESAWTMIADGKDTPGFSFETLSGIGSDCKDHGLNLTMYLLLHDNVDETGAVSEQYGEMNSVTHPEWFSHETSNGNKMLDLGNTDAVDFLKNKLADFFLKTNARTWRTDFDPIISKSDQENRHDARGTDASYWATVGFGEVLDHLYETVDGFRYECCSSGGMLKSLYMATKAVVFNVEDSATYLNLRAAFYDSSYVLHPSQLQFPCNIASFNPQSEQYFCPVIPEPEVAAGDTYDFYDAMQHMGFRTTIMGVPHWAPWDGNVLPDYYKTYCDMYESKVRPLVRDAQLYHILPRPDGTNWDGMMYADADSENEIKGLVFLFKPSATVSDTQNVVFDGLYEDTVYQLTFEDRPEQNRTATGAELMTNGIDVEIKYVGSELIWITEAK